MQTCPATATVARHRDQEPVPSDDVARYYDRNTGRFMIMGGGRSIHRELWGPGVTSAEQATDYIDRMVADEVDRLVTGADPVIVDFGCGVGGTLFHLAERFPRARLHGLTVSPRQVEIAERLAQQTGHADRCAFSLGDFQTADLELDASVIVAVESFVHSDSADAFVANAARHLQAGGYLIIADDFLASEPDALPPRQRRCVDRFRAGWRVPTVCTPGTLIADADQHGLALEKSIDLTSLTRPGSRVRDHLTAALSPVLARLGLSGIPFCGNLIGGNALQIGLRDGFLEYRLLIFQKRAP